MVTYKPDCFLCYINFTEESNFSLIKCLTWQLLVEQILTQHLLLKPSKYSENYVIRI